MRYKIHNHSRLSKVTTDDANQKTCMSS